MKDKYYLLIQWYDYFKNKELKDNLTNSINILQDKLKHLKDINNIFNIISFELYFNLINSQKFNNWNKSNIQYNLINKFDNNIKLRIINFLKLNDTYIKNSVIIIIIKILILNYLKFMIILLIFLIY